MQLTPDNILRIQIFLSDNNFIQEAPDKTWTPHKASGYRTYLESKNLRRCDTLDLPYNLDMLTSEMRDFVQLPDSVTLSISEDKENEDDTDTGTEDENKESTVSALFEKLFGDNDSEEQSNNDENKETNSINIRI